MTCVGILGTQTVMAPGMFGKLAPVQVLAPEGPELKRVHDAYVALVRSATPTPELRTIFEVAGRKMVERCAQAILLGATDLNAMFGNGEAQMPIIDCASTHIAEIARHI